MIERIALSFLAPFLLVQGRRVRATVPRLPQPLRWYLGRRARRFSRAFEADVGAESDVRFQSLRFTLDPSLMASDGFHPGPEIYRGWANRVVAAVRAADLN